MNIIKADCCPRCGDPVIKAYRLNYEEDETKIREIAVDGEKRCVTFYGSYEMNEGESIDFSEIKTLLKPERAEVYVHA